MRLLCCVIVVSRTFLTTLATTTAATAAAMPHNIRRVPPGFHHYHPPFLRGCRNARACGPIVTPKSFRRMGNIIVLFSSSSSLQRGGEAAKTAVEMVEGCGGGDGAPSLPNTTLRNVVVTGANRGLGFAIAERMLALGGYRVVLACRSRHEVCVYVCDLSCAS